MDYQKAYFELKDKINAVHKGYMDAERQTINTCDYLKGCKTGVEICAGVINTIEEKYQLKQYTWNEVLEMNPWPKRVQSYINIPYGILNGRYCEMAADLSAFKSYYGLDYNPSVPEMQNLWTII